MSCPRFSGGSVLVRMSTSPPTPPSASPTTQAQRWQPGAAYIVDVVDFHLDVCVDLDTDRVGDPSASSTIARVSRGIVAHGRNQDDSQGNAATAFRPLSLDGGQS